MNQKPFKSYTAKEPATISGQIEKLKRRGLIINDEKFAAETLTYINYYRLVHYFSVFADDNKNFAPGATFEQGLRLYDFDRRLRSVFLIILEETEVSMRAVISNYHALKYGALGYLNESSFNSGHNRRAFLNKIEYMIETNKNEDFVKHYKNKYNGAFPLWVIMELFSFGALSYFYSDMKHADKKALAGLYFPEKITPGRLGSWLECLSALRNNCAHYNRIYANSLNVSPAALPELGVSGEGNLFNLALIMKLLHKRPEIWNNGFVSVLKNLFSEYVDIIDITVMDFPENWEELLSFSE